MTNDLTKLTEAELRDHEVQWPKTEAELMDIVRQLAERKHDYGTCVYAMSIAATAAFQFIAHKLGVTGFQASCADMDVVRRVRHMKHGFRIVNYADLLYPQYEASLTMSPRSMLAEPDVRKHIRAEATRLLAERGGAHESVILHWQRLAALPVLPGEER